VIIIVGSSLAYCFSERNAAISRGNSVETLLDSRCCMSSFGNGMLPFALGFTLHDHHVSILQKIFFYQLSVRFILQIKVSFSP
jgi:hypothetical protein